MPTIEEVRVMLPFTMEEFHVGHRYGSLKLRRDRHDAKTVRNHVTDNVAYTGFKGNPCVYSAKQFHLIGFVPRWARRFLPGKSAELSLDSRSWDEFPVSCNILSMSAPLNKKMSFRADVRVVESSSFEDDVFGLDAKTKRARKIRVLDFSSHFASSSSSSSMEPHYDVKRFESKVISRRGRLQGSWKASSSPKPKICVYILMNVHVGIFGVASKAERLFLDNYASTYIKMAQCAYCTMDEWMDLDVNQVMQLEQVDTSNAKSAPPFPDSAYKAIRARL